MKAEYISATLYFNDGSKKTGFAELVDSEDKKVKFKLLIDGKKEKILSDDLKKIEFKDKNNAVYISERLNIWSIGFMKFKYLENKFWLYFLSSQGNYSLYVTTSATRLTRAGTNTYQSFGETWYYYRSKMEKVAFVGFFRSNAGIAIEVGRGKIAKNMVKEMFKGKCNLDKEIDNIKFDRHTREDQFKILDILAKSACK